MHEAGLIADAVGSALRTGAPAPAGGAPGGPSPGPPSRPRGLRVTVLDPVHVSADAARLYAEVVLRAQDLADVPLEVVSVEVACDACRAPNWPEPQHPFCEACGWPLPRAIGPEVAVDVAW